MKPQAVFTVDLEWPWHATRLPEDWPPKTGEWEIAVVERLVKQLGRYGVKARFFILGHLAHQDPDVVRYIEENGHQLGSHGYWHRHNEAQGDTSDQKTRQMIEGMFEVYEQRRVVVTHYRSPFWDTTPWPGRCGGVWFRLLPLPVLRWFIARAGMFYVHPHDLQLTREGPLRRRVTIGNPWQRLEWVLRNVEWQTP